MVSVVDIFCFISIIFGMGFILWRKKRKFDRINAAGVEHFQSYGGKIAARTGDALLWLLALCSLTMGIVLLAHENSDSWGWIVLLPLYGFLLIGGPIWRSK